MDRPGEHLLSVPPGMPVGGLIEPGLKTNGTVVRDD